MKLDIKLKPGYYSNPINCPIAKGLRERGIIAVVSNSRWCGLLYGIIPVSGKIGYRLNDFAMSLQKPTRVIIRMKFFGLF